MEEEEEGLHWRKVPGAEEEEDGEKRELMCSARAFSSSSSAHPTKVLFFLAPSLCLFDQELIIQPFSVSSAASNERRRGSEESAPLLLRRRRREGGPPPPPLRLCVPNPFSAVCAQQCSPTVHRGRT